MSVSRIPAALRQRIFEAARYRCGYCLTSQLIIGPFLEIDHLLPESRDGTSDEDNLWLACPRCNSHKSDRILVTDPDTKARVPLFNPRSDQWSHHFDWIEGGAVIYGKTPVGRATATALQMNHPDSIAVRRLWVSVGWHPPSD